MFSWQVWQFPAPISRTRSEVRVFVEVAGVFKVCRVNNREVVVVYKTDDVFNWAQVRSSASTTVYSKTFAVETQRHPPRDVFPVVKKPEVVLVITRAAIHLERHPRGVRNERRLLNKPNSGQYVLNSLVVGRVQHHFELITRNHFQHVVHDVSHEPVGTKQSLHDLEPVAAFLQLVQIGVA